MSIAQTGKKMSDEARAKMSARVYEKEWRDRMSAIKKGVVHSDETKAKMSASHKLRAEKKRRESASAFDRKQDLLQLS